MVWAGISATGKTDLVFIDRNLNCQRYIDQVRTPRVLPFLRQMPVADPIFQDDNARPHRDHRAHIVDDFFGVNNMNRMEWTGPPYRRICPVLGTFGTSMGALFMRVCRETARNKAFCSS